MRPEPGQGLLCIVSQQLPTAMCPWSNKQKGLAPATSKFLIQANDIRQEKVIPAAEQAHRCGYLGYCVPVILRFPPIVLRLVVFKQFSPEAHWLPGHNHI